MCRLITAYEARVGCVLYAHRGSYLWCRNAFSERDDFADAFMAADLPYLSVDEGTN